MTEPSRQEETNRPKGRTGPWAVLALLVATLAGVAADLGTKEWAIRNLAAERVSERAEPVCEPNPMGFMTMDRVRRPPVVISEGFFELRYAENCGAAFGFMNTWSSLAKRLIFFPVAIGAVLVLGFMFLRGRGGPFLAMAVPLIISGAIGNFVDRIRFGYVVDFIRFYGETPAFLTRFLGPVWEYPTFNIADVAISLGVVFLLIDGWLEGKKERAASDPDARVESAPAPNERADLSSEALPPEGEAGDEAAGPERTPAG